MIKRNKQNYLWQKKCRNKTEMVHHKSVVDLPNSRKSNYGQWN